MAWGLQGKVCLVTGGNRGIGLEVVRRLAGGGARVLLVSRNEASGKAAAEGIRGATEEGNVEVIRGDLGSLAEVRLLASRVLEAAPRLHLLVNNAGILTRRRSTTPDGLETQFAVNHLGPFLLTHLLWPALREAAPSRVVSVASEAHRRGTLEWDDLQMERRYSPGKAYARSKLANVLFAAELARRSPDQGVTSVSVHPGVYATGVLRDLLGPLDFLSRLFPGPESGGANVTEVALLQEFAEFPGAYYRRTKRIDPSRLARDPEAARRLWEESARLTGVHPDA